MAQCKGVETRLSARLLSGGEAGVHCSLNAIGCPQRADADARGKSVASLP